jgi:hypothetical protein
MRVLRHRWSRFLALGLIVALVAGVILWRYGPLSANQAESPALAPQSSASAEVAPGVTVLLPDVTDPEPYHLTTAPATSAATKSLAKSAYLVPLAKPLDFRSAQPVPKGTRVRYQLKPGITTPVFEAYFDEHTGRWVPESTRYDRATGVATATVAHFSVHDMFTWSTDRIKVLFEGAFQNLFSPFLGPQTTPPECGLANDVAMHETNPGKSVLSCHDATVIKPPSGNQPGTADIGVRLVNTRRYPIDVIYPATASATTDNPGSVAAQIGAAITKAVATPPGTKRILLSAGATATLIIHGAHPPFANLKISTEFDGEAYLVGILGTALEELAAFTLIELKVVTRSLLTALSVSKVLLRAQSELTDNDLSPKNLKVLGDVGLDALQAVFDNTAFFAATGIFSVVVSFWNIVLQTIWGEIDTITGQTNHEFTFSTYGTTWSGASDLHKVDWPNFTIPGEWFLGPKEVKLVDGIARKVPTHIQFDGADEAESVSTYNPVAYGDLDGDGKDEAALQISVNGSSVAAGERINGWLVYRGGADGPELIGVMLPQVPPVRSWVPNSRHVHITYISDVVFKPGRIVTEETYYNESDYTCCPSGAAVTTWTYKDGKLTPGKPVR